MRTVKRSIEAELFETANKGLRGDRLTYVPLLD